MSKRTTILLIGMLLTALPVLAMMKSNSYIIENTLVIEKCSNEIEKLKLCVENPKIVINSGEQVRINLFWFNTSDSDRYIGSNSTGYSVTVTNETGKKVLPVSVQILKEKQKQMKKSGEKDKEMRVRVFNGSDRGLYAEANGIDKDEINLADARYDYDISTKGKYFVRIEKTVRSLEGNKQITFVVDNIEIQVQ